MSTYKRANMTEAPVCEDNCPEFLERYLDYLSSFCNKRPATVIEYSVALRDFAKYIHYINRFHSPPSTKDAHKDLDISAMPLEEISRVSQEGIEEYLGFLELKVGNKANTLRKKLFLLREFYSYLEENAEELGITLPKGNPTKYIPMPDKTQEQAAPLTFYTVEQLMNSTYGETAERDAAIILLMATTALQVSEIVSLNRSDVHNGYLTVPQLGKEPKVMNLTPACETKLRSYMMNSENYFTDDSALFKSKDGKSRLTQRAIQFRIERIAMKAGLSNQNITAQSLRDTGAAFILSSVPPIERQGMLRYLGYNPAYAVRRFSWLFPKKDMEQQQIASQILRNSKYLSKLGESAPSESGEASE